MGEMVEMAEMADKPDNNSDNSSVVSTSNTYSIDCDINKFLADIENGKYKNTDLIASMIPYKFEDVVYSLDINAEPQLRKRIAAAIASYKDGVAFDDVLASMDDDNYSDDNSINSHNRIREMMVEGSYMAAQVVGKYFKENFEKRLHEVQDFQQDSESRQNQNNNDAEASQDTVTKSISLAQCLFILSMERLSTSFQATVLLLNSGFYIEVMPIFRQIYEQFAWACYLVQEKDDSKIKKNQTQSDVKYLKQALDNRYGELYGIFSKETHLEPESIKRYLIHDEENYAIRVRHRSGEESNEETITLLVLLKIFGEVIHYGMKSFGYPETGAAYFNTWFRTHLTLCDKLRDALVGKCTFNRINNSIKCEATASLDYENQDDDDDDE